MAKVALNKLGLKRDDSVETLEWNEQIIEVKQYLPIQEKADLIALIIAESLDDDSSSYNPLKVYTFTIVETILAYTNISLTEKQKADVAKLYDLFVSSGLSGKIIGEIMNPYEYKQISAWVNEIIENIYKYKNSALGILDAVKDDYKALDFESTDIQNKIKDPENLALLKEILTKMG